MNLALLTTSRRLGRLPALAGARHRCEAVAAGIAATILVQAVGAVARSIAGCSAEPNVFINDIVASTAIRAYALGS